MYIKNLFGAGRKALIVPLLTLPWWVRVGTASADREMREPSVGCWWGVGGTPLVGGVSLVERQICRPWWNNGSVDLSGTADLPTVSMLVGGMLLVERQICRPWWNNVSVDLSGTAALPTVSVLLGWWVGRPESAFPSIDFGALAVERRGFVRLAVAGGGW